MLPAQAHSCRFDADPMAVDLDRVEEVSLIGLPGWN
jgi:hypothetical protein